MAKAKKQEPTETKSAGAASESPKKATAKPAAAVMAPAAKPASAVPKSEKMPAAAKGAKTPTMKAAASKSPAPAPLIQTSFAAETAAKMIAQRAAGDRINATGAAASATPRPESSTFRNLKQGLANPSIAGLNGILGAPQNQKKTNAPFGGGNQVGRGQTFGAASKLNVPRRTGG